MQDARVVASLGIMVGKTERVDMAFTRAHGVAHILVSILDIEFVPDVVKWAYRGQVYNLQIEFEDDSLFAEAPAATDVDMHEDDEGAGVKETPTADPGREMSEGPGSVAQTTGDGTAPPSSVPSTTLRFGSIEPATAPPRLWSERVESFDDFEHSLPALDFEGPGVEDSSAEDISEIEISPDCVETAELQVMVPSCAGGSRQVALGPPSPLAPVGVTVSGGSPSGGGLGQVAAANPSPQAAHGDPGSGR